MNEKNLQLSVHLSIRQNTSASAGHVLAPGVMKPRLTVSSGSCSMKPSTPKMVCPEQSRFPEEKNMTDIQNARILMIATDGCAHSELLLPLQTLRQTRASVETAAPDETSERAQITR